MDVSQFFYSPDDGHLGCFHFGATTNKAAMNIHAYVIVWTYVFIYLGWNCWVIRKMYV